MKIAVIPARGGSKRIPRKNIRPFAGKPIMAHSIETALKSGLFDHVIVSTDDPEIAEIARTFGAEVPFMRPTDLADDHSVIASVIQHAIKWYESQGQLVDYACCVYATAPLMSSEDIFRGFLPLKQGAADMSIAVTRFSFPIQRAFRLDAESNISMFQPEHAMTRSQDLEEAYHDAAHFVWGSRDAFIGMDRPLRQQGIVVDQYKVQDIDTEADWYCAELLYTAHHAIKPESVGYKEGLNAD